MNSLVRNLGDMQTMERVDPLKMIHNPIIATAREAA
jgi:hypothetical protein